MLGFENQGVGWPVHVKIMELEPRVSKDNWIARLQFDEIEGEGFDMKADNQLADDIICND